MQVVTRPIVPLSPVFPTYPTPTMLPFGREYSAQPHLTMLNHLATSLVGLATSCPAYNCCSLGLRKPVTSWDTPPVHLSWEY